MLRRLSPLPFLRANRKAALIGAAVFVLLAVFVVPTAYSWSEYFAAAPTGLFGLPNIGALTSGVLMVAVGFSAGTGQGLWAIFVYFFIQNVDAYLVIPYIARKTVDLAPALVLAMQLLMGALFGILGVLFADPILAALKVSLVELSRFRQEEAAAEAQSPG